MNDLLSLKGIFEKAKSKNKFGKPTLPANVEANINHLLKIEKDIRNMIDFWSNQILLENALITVTYNRILAKSNRIKEIFKMESKDVSEYVVGARFDSSKLKHIITYYMPIKNLKNAIEKIIETINVLNNEFNGLISRETFNQEHNNVIDKVNFNKYNISKSTFKQIIVDSVYIENIGIENNDYNLNNASVVSLYKTDDIKKVLNKLGIQVFDSKILDQTTLMLDKNQIDIIKKNAPFLISMGYEDLSTLHPSDFKPYSNRNEMIEIPDPINEPVIGVIDTLFDNNVYFSKWVEYEKHVSDSIDLQSDDYKHGTAISSLIVDGPRLNPHLDDGCGRFRVKHFGVSLKKGYSSFTIIKKIKEIVSKNPNIKVWNISLGSNEEINDNFISVEGYFLDKIQCEYDVIFVIAATNKKANEGKKKIGSPADSINSLVVGSVDKNNNPVNYLRDGFVLSFYIKPDVSYYGGSDNDYITVCEPLGEAKVCGTSFAAPWVSRKVAYLIYVLGFNKEMAKALIIDAAIGWNNQNKDRNLIGRGVVPIKINDIVESADDEIKFVITEVSEKYDTYNFNIPVPVHKEGHPFIAKATLCYFPTCSRNQGVDYTDTELDLYFGRLDDSNKIKSINKNKQSIDDESYSYLNEDGARKIFDKWDNVKHIKDEVKTRYTARKAYKSKLWGISVKRKQRLGNNENPLRFGIVITLKEINGINRIDDFIYLCSFNQWIVNRINVKKKVDLFIKGNEDIELK